MATLNRMMIIGRVGRVYTKTFTNGDMIINATVATSKRYKNKDNETVDETQWHNLVCYGQAAKYVDEHIKKGDLIYAEGEMAYRKYAGRDGREVNVAEVRVNIITHISSPDKED